MGPSGSKAQAVSKGLKQALLVPRERQASRSRSDGSEPMSRERRAVLGLRPRADA